MQAEKVVYIAQKNGEARMDTGRGQIDLFLRKCDEVMQSRFIIADTKIGELLKSIATSDLLYAFFREITKDFDYDAARRECLGGADASGRCKLSLPEDPEKKLAFIFCLLVEFDNKTLDLGSFLREYFYGDGSVYEGFYAFSNQIIKPFKNAVKVLFCESACESFVGEDLAQLVAQERKRVYFSNVSDGQKVDAMLILNALEEACSKKSDERIAALLCGYLSFARCEGFKSENIESMRKIFSQIKEIL